MNERHDVNWERSREIADLLGLEKRQCYKNAVLALLSIPALQSEGFCYVEGHVFDHVSMGHGWLASDKEILDPTLALSERPTDHEVLYFAAVTYTAKEVEELATIASTPYVSRDGYGGHSIPAYNESDECAVRALIEFYNN